MTTEEKAKEIAIQLMDGEDRNIQPLIDALVEMAYWQQNELLNKGIKVQGFIDWYRDYIDNNLTYDDLQVVGVDARMTLEYFTMIPNASI